MCQANDDKKTPPPDMTLWPEEARGSRCGLLYSRWTYAYMNRVLSKGSKQTLKDGTHLSKDDLFPVPSSMKSEQLASAFLGYYEKERGRKRRMLRTLWGVAAPDFVPAGFCQLATVFAQVAIPLLVQQLLRILEDHPRQAVTRQGMPYAILVFVASVVNAFANQRHRHLATKAGIDMRAAIVRVVYEKALKMTPNGKLGLTSGEVTNLVAVDTQKLFEVAQEGHLIWSCPLSMTVVSILLLIVMGPSTLVGMAVLFLFVPLVKGVASAMLAIRHKRAKLSDERVETVNAMLQGIRVTKLNNYESKYKERIETLRRKELKLLNREVLVWGLTLVMTVVSPVLATASTFATFVLISENNILTAATTFTVLLLFSALRFPINYMGRLIGRAGQALESARRIEKFLERETEDDLVTPSAESLDPPKDKGAVLRIQDVTFSRGLRTETPNEPEAPQSTTQTGFRLSGVSCHVQKGEILAVVGPVGSGKSTLVDGIIGEALLERGSVHNDSKATAYASQIPFVLNTTLRENILFGLPFDRNHYEKVLDACCLRQDIEQLGAAGDQTEIGERGVTLSGGQKQRVSLARAAYANAELVLCDDPLSALDAGTGKRVFERLFKAKDGLLSNAGTVLVTHANHFLHRVDRILLLVDGEMRFLGTWTELLEFHSTHDATRVAVDSIRASVQEDSDEEDLDLQDGASSAANKSDRGKASLSTNNTATDNGELMTVEQREHGYARMKTWLLWFKHAGGLGFLLMQVLLLAMDRVAYVATEFWLSTWTDGADGPITVFGVDFPAQTDGYSAQYRYLAVYGTILFVSCLSTFLRSEWAVTGGARCAKNVFSAMLDSVLRAPMLYFETTPLGRTLNRFTYDVEVVDLTLTEAMSILMIATGWFVAGVSVMCTILPWIAVALAPVVFSYLLLMLYYRKSGPDLQRIDAVARSPVQSLLSEGLDGAATIKVFEKRESFLSKYEAATNDSSAALLNFISAQRWLAIRIEVLGALIVLVAVMLVITSNNVFHLEPGLVGLLIIWSSNFTITLGFLMDHFSEAEAAITSIERVDAMSQLPSEKAMETDPSIGLPATWPEKGCLVFEDVCLRYREGLPLALKGLSFEVPAGKRCGVVGRTGAGKSTLSVALFRLVEVESGRISLDGVDLGSLGLSDVRSRLSVIPQDPFLFAGTLRECVDPFGLATDESILESLRSVRLCTKSDGVEVLERRVEEGGVNYSVGERQLLCLARALLANPKVLVMDEATASVDGETDAFIQRMLRNRFQDTTLLTVAHRLNTVMDYDTILVMENGRAVEFGAPSELLERNGLFADLVQSTGEESARALREMATK